MANDDTNPVTKVMLDQAVDAILAGMDKVAGNLKNEFKNELDPLKKDIGAIKADVKFINRDIEDIKAELSDTPSRREFTDLKDKVDEHLQYHKD